MPAHEPAGECEIGDEKGEGRGVCKTETGKNGGNEGIRAALGEDFADPEWKPAVKRELRAEDFVFAKIEEEEADGDAERGERAGVAVVMRDRHRWMIVKPGCREKKRFSTPTVRDPSLRS